MPHPIPLTRTQYDQGDFCPGCRRVSCRCAPEPEWPPDYARAYRAGYDDGLHDGLDQRPLTETIYRSGHRVVYEGGRVLHVMTALTFRAFTWRRSFASEVNYLVWFERQYGHALSPYLAGYDDACCGLPSAADDPEAHAEAARALDGYRHEGFDPVDA